MKRVLFSFLWLCASVSSVALAQHRVLVSGCGQKSIFIVDKDKQVEWSMPYEDEVSDASLMPNGNILHSSKNDGIFELKPDYASGKGGEIMWSWKPSLLNGKMGEVHSCQILFDGVLLVGVSHDGVSFIYEVSKKTGAVLKKIELKGLGGAHSTFRQIRKTSNASYLITQQAAEGKAKEFSSEGKFLREFPDGRYVAIPLANKNTLISCGDVGRIIEVDQDNKIVWELKKDDIEGITLGFVAGLQRLSNGNTVLTNWGGHGNTQGPSILEVTREKKLVWSYDPEVKNRASSIQVLDAAELRKPQR